MAEKWTAKRIAQRPPAGAGETWRITAPDGGVIWVPEYGPEDAARVRFILKACNTIAGQQARKRTERTCAECGVKFMALAYQKYHEPRCQQRAYMRERRQRLAAPSRKRKAAV